MPYKLGCDDRTRTNAIAVSPCQQRVANVLAISGLAISQILSAHPVTAQIRLDRTTETRITQDCSTQCRISGDSIFGSNLFHSFERFSIREDARVIFSNPGVENILVRVTGNRRSQLRGALQVRGSANFFLINPNGIIFRDGAQLDINGTFVATTADSIAFGDRGEFSAINPETDTSLLTVQPSALRFLSGEQQAIHNQASLSFSALSNPSLVFVGGLIKFSEETNPSGDHLRIENGLLQLATVSGIGDVEFNAVTQRVEVPDAMQRGRVLLSDVVINVGRGELTIDAGQIQGSNVTLEAFDVNANAGSVRLRATDRIELTGDSPLRSSISTSSSSSSNSPGEIILEAGNEIQLINSSVLGRAGGASNGSRIRLQSNTLALLNQSFITSQTVNTGNAGEIVLDIRDTIEMSDSSIVSAAAGSSGRVGNAGTINIDTESLQLDASAQISTSVFGNGSRGGNIFIQTNTLNLGNSSEIVASVTSSQPGGNITIDANFIELDQTSRIEAERFREGNITLRNVDVLFLRAGSTIATRSLVGSDSNNLNIEADIIIAIPDQNNDLISSSQQGDGGNIQIVTQGIFGLEERMADEENSTNDIDADGSISIDRLAVDPSHSLADLPDAVVNIAGLIDQDVCQATGNSEFVNVGRGGIPSTETEILSDNAVWEDWRLTYVEEEPRTILPQETEIAILDNLNSQEDSVPSPTHIIEAHGWQVDSEGAVELIADVPELSSQQQWAHSQGCRNQ